MRFLFRTLSTSYFSRHRVQTLLTAIGVATGVATFASIRTAHTTLVSSLQVTVDRVAGRAQLQVTALGGVAEDTIERIGEVPEVAAQAPIIEQVVETGSAEQPLSLLVLGVDLLGDRRMRDYGFDEQDAEIDDPLEFLAQPDSIAVARSFAERAGVRVGDALELRSGPRQSRVVVRGLLRSTGFAEAFGGNVAITDVYAAQELFGRSRRFDRIDIRLQPDVSLEDGAAALARAVGAGYVVETPDSRGAQMDQLVSGFAAAFEVSSFLALAMGVFVIVNVLTVAVDRRRRDIGILRAVGATPRQIQVLFLAEATAFGLAGGLVGLLFSQGLTRWFLGVMGGSVATAYGLETQAQASVDGPIAIAALVLGVGAALVGGWGPARRAARLPPTVALASGVFRARQEVQGRRTQMTGAGLFVTSLVLTRAPLEPTMLMVLVLLSGMFGTVMLTGPLADWLLRRFGSVLARISPVAGHVARDALLSQPRRTAMTTAAVALSLAFVLGAGGYLHSTETAFNRWMDAVITEDLLVRASLRLTPGQQRLPGEFHEAIMQEPAVSATDAYRADWVSFRGEPVMLFSADIATLFEHTDHEFTQGTLAQLLSGLIDEGQCAVSDNFARRHDLATGDVIELPSPHGLLRLPISAVVSSYVSDRGMILIDRGFFQTHWQDASVDGFHVRLEPGADPQAVRGTLAARLAPLGPSLISTREEFVEQANSALDGFYALTRLTILMALVVAFVAIATALLISVVERSREIGILKALGALPGQVQRAVVLEALAVAGCGMVIAIPIGALLARFLETVVAESFAGFRMPHAYPVALLVQIAIGLPPLAAAAAWWPARQAMGLSTKDTISYE